MSRQNALVPHRPAAVEKLESAAAPARRVLPGMLAASVEAWGDVVRALLVDLAQATEAIDRLGWLARCG